MTPSPSWSEPCLDLAQTATILLDAEGRITWFDEAAAELAGIDAEAARGRAFESLFPTRRIEGGTLHVAMGRGGEACHFEIVRAPLGPPEARAGWSVVLRPGVDVHAVEAHYQTLIQSFDSGVGVFRMIFDASNRAVDYVFIEVNPAFEQQTGLVDVVGRHVNEIVPDLEPHWFELYGNVALTGEPIHFTQGSVVMGRMFDVYAFRLGDETSRDVAVLFTDVTAQKTTEAQLQSANERITSIMESISDGFFALDTEWRLTYVNREAGFILGCEASDLVGRVIWDVYEGLEDSEFGRTYRRVAEEKIVASFTAYYPGHDRWYEIKVSPSEVGISVFFRNVTERVRADEERTQHERDRERLLLEVETERRKIEQAYAESPAFVAILRGPDLVFDYANEPYYKIIGRRDIIGKPLIEAIPEIADQVFPELLHRIMETGEPLDIPEIAVWIEVVPGQPQEERWIHIRYVPMREVDDTITGVFAHGLDITEAVRARRILAARAEETALGSRRKDEFLATLAHELRNPLAPIRLSTELMEYLEPGDPEFEEARIVITRQVDHMVRLVDDLLDVSRVAQGKIKLKREILDVAGIITAAAETSRPGIEGAGHAFEVVQPAEPIYVNGDATRLAQVLSNLLNNAAKYTPHGGRIELSVERAGDWVVLRVRDNGIGIPAEMLPHIFDMFAQVEVHLVQSQGGLGIGLTLCRRLVELHGGSIVAQTEGPGHGSEFLVRLRTVTPIGRPSSAVAATDAGPVQPRRVLVVDDNGDNAWTLGNLIETMGHEVRVAHTGHEALSVAAEFRPEVVLLDLGLPDLPGYEVARRLRAHPDTAGAHLVAQTGWGREEDRALGREAGFDAHLVKPLGRNDLAGVFAALEPRDPA